ncbi:hypothetical protein [Mucilaginibacter flavus]|uniref:hypothetical protein n=1 Tax=Mucilaginibacter flavus TaxID=931504 RepID=UPI0025B4C2CE|nr:hypothetical protein [Mucilaginibacter flavus]MDN3579228.1 hypothetical protein [Mucilaginibacter flavus]
MDITYQLVVNEGVEMIIIPELDCGVYVIDPRKGDIAQNTGDVLAYANIRGKELAFKMVGEYTPENPGIAEVIRWYSYQKTFSQGKLSA